MKAQTKWILMTLVLIISASGWPQETDLTKHPGYINLEKIKIPGYSEEVTDITLGPPLLRLIASSSMDEDGNITEDVAGLLSIRVKTFEVNEEDSKRIRTIMEEIEEKLYSDKWEFLIKSKTRDDYTNISIRYDEKGKALGLMIMSLESGYEASFVNIVGNIDLGTISRLGLGLSESALDSLENLYDD